MTVFYLALTNIDNERYKTDISIHLVFCREKRCDLSLHLKMVIEGDCLIIYGISFQDLAPEYLIDLKPGFHLNECGRIDRFDRIGREGWQFPLKRIDRFDRIDQTGFNFSIKTKPKAVVKWA